MSAAKPAFDPAVGRYLRLDIAGKPHRIYVEQAGEGIPLVCLHTAGSDGRQFRGLLNDPQTLARFRVIAFDLPWAGKSPAPAVRPKAEADRWETIWHYMQGGPGVFKGDLHFYTADGDVRGRVAEIDTGKCPLYLLTGEYDYSATPQITRELAARIKGAEATIMPGLGH